MKSASQVSQINQISFLDLAQKVLEEVGRPLTPGEIWQEGESLGYAKQVTTRGKTPWTTVGAQMYVSMRDDSNSPFCKVGERPRRFFLKRLQTDNQGTATVLPDAKTAIDNSAGSVASPVIGGVSGGSRLKFLESQLHPFLAYHVFYQLKAYTKTIQHLRSDKKEFGEWVHPDMVGCYLPLGDWEPEALEIATLAGHSAIRLYSFELKRELSFGNLRESFFQAVSNSSWANQGFLVAARVSTDNEFREELGRLSSSFGIWVLSLDVTDPDGGEVIFPARERQLPDWEMVNKLAAMNPDFREFLRDMRFALQTKQVYRERFDVVRESADLIASIKSI